MKDIKFRRCYGCKYYTSLVRERIDKNFIGICNKYNQKVIDTLCGCEVKDGITILKNFTKINNIVGQDKEQWTDKSWFIGSNKQADTWAGWKLGRVQVVRSVRLE